MMMLASLVGMLFTSKRIVARQKWW
jgi:hypothetical protein